MNTTYPDGYVTAVNEQGITTIEFYHPQSNSLPSAILQSLATAIQEAGKDTTTTVIVLKSYGEKSFCAGASFDELMQISSEEKGLAFFSGFANVINAIRTCQKFVIARIQGKCVGGGVGLAAAADYAIALDTADVKLSELAVGIGPFVVGPAVERKMGTSAFTTLSIDASSWRSSQWAYQNGLFSEIHSTVENLNDAVMKLSNTLSKSSPEAMRELKTVFWKGTEHWDSLLKERAAISGRLVLSEFTRNAIEQFKSKK